MTDTDRIQAAFMLGIAHANVVESGTGAFARSMIEKAVKLLAGELSSPQGWDIQGRPLL